MSESVKERESECVWLCVRESVCVCYWATRLVGHACESRGECVAMCVTMRFAVCFAVCVAVFVATCLI